MKNADHSHLHGFPVVKILESEGPVHIQTITAIENGNIFIYEILETDAKVARKSGLILDRRGNIIERQNIFESPPDREMPLQSFPINLDSGELQLLRTKKTLEIRLQDYKNDDLSVKIASLPKSESLELRGFASENIPGKAPVTGAVSWEWKDGKIRVRGVTVLDLKSARAQMHQIRGISEHRKGNYLSAADHFRMAMQEDPEDPLGAYNLACALAGLDRINNAIYHFKKAAAIDETRIRVYAAIDRDLDPLRERKDFLEAAGPGAKLRTGKTPMQN